MDMQGEARIPAPRSVVWEALNDPEALKASIPGCEELTQEGGDSFSAKVRAKVGPVSARFAGNVALKDIDPPNGYRIEGEGAGGAAGFAKGGAKVRLEDDGAGGTVLKYDVTANVGGKLAQIGARLIDGAARKMADDFFQRFSDVAASRAAGAASPEPAAAVAPASAPEPEPVPEPAPAPQRVERVETVTSTTVEETPPPAPSAAAAPSPAPQAQPEPEPQPQTQADYGGENRGAPVREPGIGGGATTFMWVAALVFIVSALLYIFF